jgi:hypothetical protein
MTFLVNGLRVIRICRLILTIDDNMSLTLICIIINYVLTEGVIRSISRNGIIFS